MQRVFAGAEAFPGPLSVSCFPDSRFQNRQILSSVSRVQGTELSFLLSGDGTGWCGLFFEMMITREDMFLKKSETG